MNGEEVIRPKLKRKQPPDARPFPCPDCGQVLGQAMNHIVKHLVTCTYIDRGVA